MLSKKVNNKKSVPNFIFFSEKKNQKDSDDIKITLKVKFWHFLTPPHYTSVQNSIISFEYVDFFQPKNFLILYPSFENSTTGIAIVCTKKLHKKYLFLNFFLIFFVFLGGSKLAKYLQSIVSCSTGDTSVCDFYIMTLVRIPTYHKFY